jgi:hypothetical protein
MNKDRGMEETNWLPLLDYSTKHNVSISTLRRRIKDKSIPFKLEDGRYYIIDDQIEKTAKGRKPISLHTPQIPQHFLEDVVESPALQKHAEPSSSYMIEELKKAYATALQSKEELIFQLKEEVADLKTLVRVLEEEIERLRSTTSHLY